MVQHKQAFTLIELLVVVLIIGILTAVALQQYSVVVAKSRLISTLPLLVKFQQDQELFYLANGSYASTWEELGTDLPANVSAEEDNGASFYFEGNKYILSHGGAEVWVQIFSPLTHTMELHLYGIHSNNPGKRSCHVFSKVGEQVCKSIGGQEFERTTSWVKYWIPEV